MSSTAMGPPVAPQTRGCIYGCLLGAAIEATEEAILNSLLAARTTTGYLGHRQRAVSAGYIQALVSGR